MIIVGFSMSPHDMFLKDVYVGSLSRSYLINCTRKKKPLCFLVKFLKILISHKINAILVKILLCLYSFEYCLSSTYLQLNSLLVISA